MEFFVVIAITGAIYSLPGLIWYVWEVYSEWNKGFPIRGEDVINLPIAMLLWPVPLVDNMINWMSERWFNKSDAPRVPFQNRVLIQGRLSARVERALRE